MDALLRIADIARYAAKAGGRNCVHYEPVSGRAASMQQPGTAAN
jgi:hypothetical protein